MAYNFIGIAAVLFVPTLVVAARLKYTRRKERENIKTGLELMGLIKQVIVLTQQHRGTSNAYRQGSYSQKSTLLDLQTRLDALIAEGNYKNLAYFPQWESFTEHWPRLKQYVLSDDDYSQNIMRQHNMMIEGQLSLFDDLTRYYNLHTVMLDNVTRVSELCLDTLRTVETIGQARAIGTGMCAKGVNGGVDSIALNFLKLSLTSSAAELCNTLPTIKNSELAATLTRSASNIIESSQHLVTTIESQVLVEGPISLDSKKYFDLATSSIDELLTVFTAVEDYALKNFTAEN
mgnify:CR=1 FL=1